MEMKKIETKKAHNQQIYLYMATLDNEHNPPISIFRPLPNTDPENKKKKVSIKRKREKRKRAPPRFERGASCNLDSQVPKAGIIPLDHEAVNVSYAWYEKSSDN